MRHIDYLINLSILKKNSEVIEYLINEKLPTLYGNVRVYDNIREKIEKLKNECYPLILANPIDTTVLEA